MEAAREKLLGASLMPHHRLSTFLLPEKALVRETRCVRRKPLVCTTTVPLKLQVASRGPRGYKQGISNLCYNK